jgi:hypothetical protein
VVGEPQSKQEMTMSTMNLITRSEASHRLKIISTLINNAVSAVRDGNWEECSNAANDALDLLSKIIPHLEEATEETPVAPRIGGMGYRGSNNIVEKESTTTIRSSLAPPVPISLPKKKVTITAIPTVTSHPIVTPPPIISQLEETRTFDLTRICGQLAYYKCVQADPDVHPNWEMTEAFDRLPKDQQERVITLYNQTGKPVTLSDI